MLIGGRLHEGLNDVNIFIEILKTLSTGLPEKQNSTPSIIEFKQGTPEFQYNKEAQEAYEKWNTSRDDTDLKEALRLRKQCIDYSIQKEAPDEEAHHSMWYGFICNSVNQFEEGLPFLEKAASIFNNLGYFDRSCPSLAGLHTAILGALIKKEQERKPDQLEQITELSKQLQKIRQLYLQAGLRLRNEPIDESAYLVEQGEVGFSDKEPIGTVNVEHCVCVFIHNPETKLTALAHVDLRRNASSLRSVIDRVRGNSSISTPLQIKIVGARNSKEEPDSISGEKNNNNIATVFSSLKDENVDIVAAWIQDSIQPSAITVDPQTFSLREAVPKIRHRNTNLSLGMTNLGLNSLPLHVAFDLSKSKEYAPILLNKEVIEDLLARGKTDRERYMWHQAHQKPKVEMLMRMVELHALLTEAYQESINHLLRCLNETIDVIKNSDPRIHINEVDIQNTKALLSKIAIHVGDRAENANQQIIDFIKTPNALITINSDQNDISHAVFDLQALQDIQFNEQPYNIIRKLETKAKFTANYNEIRGWEGKSLSVEEIAEFFEIFWKKHEEKKDWEEHLDEHFSAIVNHRKWYSDIKQDFFDWYDEHPDNQGQKMSLQDKEIRFHHFFKSHQDSEDINADMANHFEAVKKNRDESLTILDASSASSSQLLAKANLEDENDIDIDIDDLIEEVKEYYKQLEELKRKNKNPEWFLEGQLAQRERFIPHMIVAENLRATEIASLMENKIFKLNLLYFDSLEDLTFAVANKKPDDSTISKGIVDTGKHFIYVEFAKYQNRVSLVCVDPSDYKTGKTTLKKIDHLFQAIMPNNVRSISLSVLNLQKASMACGYFCLNVGLDISAGPRKEINALHQTQLDKQVSTTTLFRDSFGYHFDASVYGLAQSLTQTITIINSPRYTKRNLAEIPYNKQGLTLYTHNAHRRVKQEVYLLDTRKTSLKQFSSSIDDKRLKGLTRLIHCLEWLKKLYGREMAGKVFAQYVSKIRVGIQSDWNSSILSTAKLIPKFDPIAGPNQLQAFEKLPEEQQVSLMRDIVNANSYWLSPGLRVNSLRIVNKFLSSKLESESFIKIADQLLRPLIAQNIEKLSHSEITENNWNQLELNEVLKLNTYLLTALSTSNKQIEWLTQMTNSMEWLDSMPLKFALGNHLLHCITKDVQQYGYTIQHAKVLFSTIGAILKNWDVNSDQKENEKELGFRFNAIMDYQEKMPGFLDIGDDNNPSKEFASMTVMAVNLGTHSAINDLEMTNSWMNITSRADEISAEHENWIDMDDMNAIANENSQLIQQPTQIVEIDLDLKVSREIDNKQKASITVPWNLKRRREESLTLDSYKLLQDTPLTTVELDKITNMTGKKFPSITWATPGDEYVNLHPIGLLNNEVFIMVRDGANLNKSERPKVLLLHRQLLHVEENNNFDDQIEMIIKENKNKTVALSAIRMVNVKCKSREDLQDQSLEIDAHTEKKRRLKR